MCRFWHILGFFLFLALMLPPQAAAETNFTVVIDPGHGGNDPGATHRKKKLDEKDIVLKVALKLGEMLTDKQKDIKVVYTRDKDVYPSFNDRTTTARKAKGDLFISIHVNAAEDASAHGFETYVFGITGLAGKAADEQKRIMQRTMQERENLGMDGKIVDFDKEVDLQTKILCQTQREKHNRYSREVAVMVQDAMISNLRKSSYASHVNNRGVKEKNLFVLCYSPMPAILVEMGYISNTTEEAFLNTDEALNLFVKSIYQGILKYRSNFDKRKINNQNSPDAEPADEAPAESPSQSQDETPQQSAEPHPQDPPSANTPAAKECYRIQFFISPDEISDTHRNLKGIKPSYHYRRGKQWCYCCGEAQERSDLNADLRQVKKQFPDAFIVKFDAEGNRIQ